MTTGTSTRETVISTIYTALQQISTANGYGNDPVVERTKESWEANANNCVLYCEEFEPEEVSHAAFGLEMGKANLVATAKLLSGELTDINSLAQDILKALEASSNSLSPYLSITRVQVYGNYADPSDKRLYCEVYFNVIYTYDVPIA